jgi:hypothetical protein
MRTATSLLLAASALSLISSPAGALQANPAHTHIGHVATAFGNAPNGGSLLATAQAEAATVLQHLTLAERDMSNLQWMQTHGAHVLHALDPSRQAEGPGLGMGLIAASDAIAQHIELAAGSEGASANVTTHAPHVAAAARAVAARAGEIANFMVQLARAGLIFRAKALAVQLAPGRDVNGDGQIGWGDGEGGLDHVAQHVGFIVEGEGL